jgi:hypothetical protein
MFSNQLDSSFALDYEMMKKMNEQMKRKKGGWISI